MTRVTERPIHWFGEATDTWSTTRKRGRDKIIGLRDGISNSCRRDDGAERTDMRKEDGRREKEGRNNFRYGGSPIDRDFETIERGKARDAS